MADPDPLTAATLSWLRGFRTMAESSSGRDVPPRVRQDLRRHFATWSRERATGSSSATRLTARLVFDSRLDLAPAGVRGTVDDDTWHLAYTSDDADVVLDLRRVARQRVCVDGQVLLADEGGGAPVFTAVLTAGEEPVESAPADELGRFRLPAVPERHAQLVVGNGELELTVHLDLDPARGEAP